jgi:hypothetical protein
MPHLNLVRDLQRGQSPGRRSANHFEILISVPHFTGGSPNKLITILACHGNLTGGVIVNALAGFGMQTSANVGYSAELNSLPN